MSRVSSNFTDRRQSLRQPYYGATRFLLSVVLGLCVLAGCTRESSNKTTITPVVADDDVSLVEQAQEEAKEEPKQPGISDREFREAAFTGDVATVRDALEQGVDINTSDGDGCTALMLAAFEGREQIVEYLLENSPQIDRRDASNRTALIYASSGKFPGVVNKLLNAGANVNAVDNKEQWSALMFAAAEGNIEVVRLLLKHGANPNLADIDGETALQFAVNGGHGEVAEILSEKDEEARQ